MANKIECKLRPAPEKMVRTPFRLPRYIPSVISGIKGKTKKIGVKRKDIMEALRGKKNHVVLKIRNKVVPAVIKKIQRERTSETPFHITFETLLSLKDI